MADEKPTASHQATQHPAAHPPGHASSPPAHSEPAQHSEPSAADKPDKPASTAVEGKEKAVSEKKSSAIDRSLERARAAEEAEEQIQREINERVAEQRELAHEEYVNSERGDVAAQHAEAERLMRLPTPEANKERGIAEPDPLKGPSS